MADKKEILLEINLSSKDALQNAERAKLAIEELKTQQQKLRKEYRERTIDNAAYTRQMADLTRQIMEQKAAVRDNTKAYTDAVKAQKSEAGSLQALRGELAQLTRAYDALGEAERESQVGQDYLSAIQEVTAKLNEAEQASGRFQRNVGNYQSVWDAPSEKIEGFADKLKNLFDFDAQMEKLSALGGSFEKLANTLTGASRSTIGFKTAQQQANNTSTQAQSTMNATAQATASVSDSTAQATRQSIGFRTAQQQQAQQAGATAAANTAAAGATNTLTAATKSAAGGFGSLLKASLRFIMSPIGAIIAAIGAVLVIVVKAVKQLTEAFKKNDEAMTALESVMGVFKAVGAAVGKVFEYIIKAITPVIEGIGKLFRAIVSVIPGMKQFVDAQEDIVRSSDRLEETHRQNLVKRAETNKKLAKLNNDAADSENHSIEERRDAMEQAIRLEQEMTAAEVAEAKERLRIRKIEAKQNSDTSDETMNEIAQLEAEILNLEAAGEAAQRRAISRRASFNKQIVNERKEAAKKAEEARKERIQKEEEAQRALQDLIISRMKEGQEKEMAEIRNENEKKVADLRKRLATESNLTTAARKALQAQIVLIEADTADKVAAVSEKYAKQDLDKQVAIEQEIWKARLSAVKKGSEEERVLRIAEIQYNAKVEQDALMKRLIAGELTEEQFDKLYEATREKSRLAMEKVSQEADARELAEIKQMWQNRINAEQEGSLAQMDVKIQAKQAEIEALKRLDGESDEAYKGRQIALNNELVSLTKQRADAEVAIERGKAEAMAGAFGSVSELMQAAAGENEELVKASKIAALAEVAIQQGLAIAKAVSSAAEGDPYTYAIRVATAIASTITAMISAINSINEAGSMGFAEGGLVRGAGTSTSDSIPARLSNGEFVVNAEATRRHLADLVAINGGWGNTAGSHHYATGGIVSTEGYNAASSMQAMQSAMREAVADIQPVVSVKEISTVARRVQIKENKAKL